jgi:hypothetical protein
MYKIPRGPTLKEGDWYVIHLSVNLLPSPCSLLSSIYLWPCGLALLPYFCAFGSARCVTGVRGLKRRPSGIRSLPRELCYGRTKPKAPAQWNKAITKRDRKPAQNTPIENTQENALRAPVIIFPAFERGTPVGTTFLLLPPGSGASELHFFLSPIRVL